MALVSHETAQALTRRKARYARYADTKQWDKFESIFLPNATSAFVDRDGNPITMGKQGLVFDTGKAMAAYFEKFNTGQDAIHNIGPGDFEQVGPDEVKAVWVVEYQTISRTLGTWQKIRGGGYYHETWKRVDGEWYIADLRMERAYQEESPLVKVMLAIVNVLGLSF